MLFKHLDHDSRYALITSINVLVMKIQFASSNRNFSKGVRFFLLLTMLVLPILACGSVNSETIDATLLSKADLSMQDFSGMYLVKANLSHKNLKGTDFTHAFLIGADFSFSDCTGTVFDYAQLDDAKFTQTILDPKWEAIIQIVSTGVANNRNLSNYDFSKVRITEPNFSQSDLSNVDFSYSILMGANFSNADLRDAKFTKTNLLYSDFLGANISQEQLSKAQMGCTRLPAGDIFDPDKCSAVDRERWK